MPIPFDMLAVMLFLGYYAETPVLRPPGPGESLFAVLVHAAALLAAAAAANALSLASLRRRRRGLLDRRRLAQCVDIGLRAALVAAYAHALIQSALPWSLARHFGWRLDGESFAVQLAGLAPFLPLFFCAWLPMYGLHRETNFGTWTRWSFLLHKARYNLFMLLAWLPFALLADWLGEFLLAIPFLFLLAAWAFPLALARVWGCQRVTDPEILERVHRLEAQAGARFSRVYLWEPGGGGVQNAAAVGMFPPFRYLFLTPALIRNMPGPELDSVILHELGHVRHRHLLFYLVSSLAGINLAVLLGALLPLAGSAERFVLTALLVLGYFRLVFGWLSRNMERQADLFALEKTGAARGLSNALEKLGIAAGNIRLAESWHHLGIARRVDFLRRAERDPELASRHNRRVSRIKAAGYLVSLALIAAMAWAMVGERAAGRPPPAGRDAESEAHWRRVMEIMPANPTAPLELAYRLAAAPESRDEAASLAGQAMRLSHGGEEKAAAAKLLDELEEGRNSSEGTRKDSVPGGP